MVSALRSTLTSSRSAVRLEIATPVSMGLGEPRLENRAGAFTLEATESGNLFTGAVGDDCYLKVLCEAHNVFSEILAT